MNHLLDPQNVKKETWRIKGREVVVPYYSFKERKIWGPTAIILAELTELHKRLKERRKYFISSET